MKKTLTMAVVCFGLLATVFSCKKSKNTNLKINLTATTTGYDAVNIDIKEVWVKLTKENTGWYFLKTNNTSINLATFKEGRDTLLALGSLPLSEIREVRFILGSRNSIVHHAKTYPLGINPNLENNAVSIHLKRVLTTENENVTFNIDISKSIANPSPNEYLLNPVIQVK